MGKHPKSKKMFDIIGNLPEEKKIQIRNTILRNAYYLIEDGKYLYEKGSYGHAFVLLAIACEEIAKVNMMEFKNNNSTNNDIMRNHKEKQKALSVNTFARYIPILIFKILSDKFHGEIPNDHRLIETELINIFHNFPNNFYNNATIRERYQQRVFYFGITKNDDTGKENYIPGKLSEFREKSIYVEVIEDRNGVGILSPLKFPKDNTTVILRIAQEDLYYTDLFYNEGKLVKEFDLKMP